VLIKLLGKYTSQQNFELKFLKKSNYFHKGIHAQLYKFKFGYFPWSLLLIYETKTNT